MVVVSILAPLARGALPQSTSKAMRSLGFQSSPPLQGGRYRLYGVRSAKYRVFQSSPPLQGGRYVKPQNTGGLPRGFNPRPPCKGGATGLNLVDGRFVVVSILAPLARGALRNRDGNDSRTCLFQSSPPLQGGRYPAAVMRSCQRACRFNPRPPCKGGATNSMAGHALPGHGFNPRPPCKGGATSSVGCEQRSQ